MEQAYIYTFLFDGVPAYIGISSDPDRRVRSHWKAARARNRKIYRWHRELRKALEQGVDVTVQVEGPFPRGKAEHLEVASIYVFGRKRYEPGGLLWNVEQGGDGTTSEQMEHRYTDAAFRTRQRAGSLVANRMLAAREDYVASCRAARSSEPNRAADEHRRSSEGRATQAARTTAMWAAKTPEERAAMGRKVSAANTGKKQDISAEEREARRLRMQEISKALPKEVRSAAAHKSWETRRQRRESNGRTTP